MTDCWIVHWRSKSSTREQPRETLIGTAYYLRMNLSFADRFSKYPIVKKEYHRCRASWKIFKAPLITGLESDIRWQMLMICWLYFQALRFESTVRKFVNICSPNRCWTLLRVNWKCEQTSRSSFGFYRFKQILFSTWKGLIWFSVCDDFARERRQCGIDCSLSWSGYLIEFVNLPSRSASQYSHIIAYTHINALLSKLSLASRPTSD